MKNDKKQHTMGKTKTMVQLRIVRKRRQKYEISEWYKDELGVPIQSLHAGLI